MNETKTDASQLPINQVLCGDCVEVMKTLPNESVDMSMFSPPYWGLRDYGIIGQIGLEEHPSKYVEKMVEVCQEVKRVLKKTGSMYIVIGDTYFGGGAHSGTKSMGKLATLKVRKEFESTGEMIGFGLKNWVGIKDNGWLQPKQLLGIPWRVTVALQEDGWILRNDIIWHKPNCMPSSVKDRLTNSYEHIFHFVKSRKYYYDLDAIREKPISVKPSGNKQRKPSLQPRNSHVGRSIPWDPMKKAKQYRRRDSTFQIVPTESPHRSSKDVIGRYEGKFEGFGEKAEKYGSPRARNERVVNKVGMHHGSSLTKGRACHYESQQIEDNPEGKNPGDVIKWTSIPGQAPQGNFGHGGTHGNLFDNPNGKNPADFWNITTKPFKGAHFAVYPEEVCIKPIKSSCPQKGVVLDLMCGSGTTLVVAKKLGRNYIGIELNGDYIIIAKKRLATIPEHLENYIGK